MTREEAEARGWHIWGPVGTQRADGLGGFWRAERRTPSHTMQSQDSETLDELLGCLHRWHEEFDGRVPQHPEPSTVVVARGDVALSLEL